MFQRQKGCFCVCGVCMMYHVLSVGGETITALVTFIFGKFSLVRIYSKFNNSYPYLYTWSM